VLISSSPISLNLPQPVKRQEKMKPVLHFWGRNALRTTCCINTMAALVVYKNAVNFNNCDKSSFHIGKFALKQ
jgi:tellurite resistance protein TehA-like permease